MSDVFIFVLVLYLTKVIYKNESIWFERITYLCTHLFACFCILTCISVLILECSRNQERFGMMHITMVNGNADEIDLLTINAFNFYQSNFKRYYLTVIYKRQRDRKWLWFLEYMCLRISFRDDFELLEIWVMLVTSL